MSKTEVFNVQVIVSVLRGSPIGFFRDLGFGGKGGARLWIVAVKGHRIWESYKAGFWRYRFIEPISGKFSGKIKQSSLHKKTEIPSNQNGYILLYKLFMFCTALLSESIMRETKG